MVERALLTALTAVFLVVAVTGLQRCVKEIECELTQTEICVLKDMPDDKTTDPGPAAKN